MTAFQDQLKQGRGYFAKWGTWNASAGNQGIPTASNPNDTEVRGCYHTQTFAYEIGTASTSLASGIVFTTASTGSGTLTATGALVSGGVATLDVPRAIKVTASTNLATCLITIRGTDGYGQSLTHTMIGPSGNTIGNNGSFVYSGCAFKTVTTASFTGLASAGIQIGSADVFGLPYRIATKSKVQTITSDGLYAATAGWATTAAGDSGVGPIWAGFAATGTPTASSVDVRGMVGLPTTNLADGTKRQVVYIITPNVGLTVNQDTKEQEFGVTPFTS